jgi:hypothetical protein
MEGGNKENTKPTKSGQQSDPSDVQLQEKKRSTQSKKSARAVSNTETDPTSAAANKKKQKKAPTERAKTAAATKKKAAPPKPEKTTQKPRGSIPRYIDTSNTIFSKTVSPLTDGDLSTGALYHHEQQRRWPTISGDTASYRNSHASSTMPKNLSSTAAKQHSKSSSDTNAASTPAAPVGRKTMKHVYDGQVQDANNYITNLVGKAAAPPKSQEPPKPEAPRFSKPEKTAEQRLEEE